MHLGSAFSELANDVILKAGNRACRIDSNISSLGRRLTTTLKIMMAVQPQI
jgi:hypothetical protein